GGHAVALRGPDRAGGRAAHRVFRAGGRARDPANGGVRGSGRLPGAGAAQADRAADRLTARGGSGGAAFTAAGTPPNAALLGRCGSWSTGLITQRAVGLG